MPGKAGRKLSKAHRDAISAGRRKSAAVKRDAQKRSAAAASKAPKSGFSRRVKFRMPPGLTAVRVGNSDFFAVFTQDPREIAEDVRIGRDNRKRYGIKR